MLEQLDTNTLLLFSLILLISYLVWNRITENKINIPGPTPWPVIGNLPAMFGTKNLSKSYLQLQKKYGNLVLLRIGKAVFVVVFGYKNVREVLVDNSERTKYRPPVRFIFPEGGGVGMANGQEWQNLRKFTIVALKEFGVGKKSVEQRIHEETDFLLAYLADLKNNPIDTSTLFSKVTSNIISSIIFGARFDYDDKEFNRLTDRISQLFKLQAGMSIARVLPFIRYILPSSQLSQTKKCRDDIQDYIRLRISQQRASFDPTNIRSFIDLYLEQEGKPDSKITESSLLYTIADLYFAGTDTTSVSLQWCMLYMLKYPEVYTKCQNEILEVVGEDRLPNNKDKDSLPYVLATIHEVQRIATIAPNGVAHRAVEDFNIDGMTIPKDSTIICSLLSVHLDPSVWDDPECFKPDRFLDTNGRFFKCNGFMPFSQAQEFA